MRQVTPGPAPLRSTRAREEAPAKGDAWTQAAAIWTEDFCPDSTGIEAIDELAPVHKAAMLALREAQAARNEQERAFADEDEQWQQALQGGTSTTLTGDRQRQLTLGALEEKVKTARAAVIASALSVVEAVNATEDEWRSLLQSRQTIATDARAEADRLLNEAWQKEQRIARLGVFFTRISQGSPPTFLAAGELLERDPGPRPAVFEWSRSLLDSGVLNPAEPEAS